MHKNFVTYAKRAIKNYGEAVFNILVFLPYFFSIIALSKNLFYPWKNLTTKKLATGFSLSEWFGRKSFNIISRTIGFWMRISLILFYFLLQLFFIISLPLATTFTILSLPIFYFLYILEPTDEQKKDTARVLFLGSHLLDHENYSEVLRWFEEYYKLKESHARWWNLSNLFLIPPLARDWTAGYTPRLDTYCIDLTAPGYQHKMKNALDRISEIAQIEQVLIKSDATNLLIVGEEGVGKHTIVDAFAKRVYEGRTNPILMYKRVLKLNLEKILMWFTDQKQRENFLEELLAEAAEAKNCIILIDDIDRYVGSSGGQVDLTGPIEKFSQHSLVQLIGITTPFAYQKYVFPVSKISQTFSKIDVYEITANQSESILKNIAILFESRYHLIIPYETIKATIDKSNYFLTAIPFPEKAIELLDSACASITQSNQTPRIHPAKNIVTPEVIDRVLTEKIHTPTTLTEELKKKLIHLEETLSGRVVQQTEAIKELSSAMRRSFLLIGKRKKPLATFLFLGPTGVGKTETAKAIAQLFFGSESSFIRFDMSLYQSSQDIPHLIGSIDSGNPGLLTSAIRQNPYGVLLLDEIEKANHELTNIFLTVLDEGYFTDGYGKKVDCKNLVVIATSNAASDLFFKSTPITQPELYAYLVQNKVFAPEFLNRFDGVIRYQALTADSIAWIAKKMIDRIADDIFKLHKIRLTISNEYLSTIAQKGYDKQFGARNLERVIRDELEDRVAKMVMENKIKENETISL